VLAPKETSQKYLNLQSVAHETLKGDFKTLFPNAKSSFGHEMPRALTIIGSAAAFSVTQMTGSDDDVKSTATACLTGLKVLYWPPVGSGLLKAFVVI